MSKGKILFQLSGSIACFKACQLLSKLAQEGYELEVVATPSALEFVGEATLEGLTGKRVHMDSFARGGYMNHIHLIRWADLIVLCPATANTLAKLSLGIADDLLSTLFLAHDFKKPYLIAPAMNTQMLRHPATQASLEKLRSWGIDILQSGVGNLACGEVGEGRLLEPEKLYAEIASRLPNGLGTSTSKITSSMRVLVTSGGTQEPLDGVRAITNMSTGLTGATIAEYLTVKGHEVTFLCANGSKLTSRPTSISRVFKTYSELETCLKEELSSKTYDAIIHAAAVSDYTVAEIKIDGVPLGAGAAETGSEVTTGKISSGKTLTVTLKPTPKLVSQLRDFAANPKIKIAAFKLTNSPAKEERFAAVRRLALESKPDLIIHNDLHEIDTKMGLHKATIYKGLDSENLHALAEVTNKFDLAERIEFALQQEIRS